MECWYQCCLHVSLWAHCVGHYEYMLMVSCFVILLWVSSILVMFAKIFRVLCCLFCLVNPVMFLSILLSFPTLFLPYYVCQLIWVLFVCCCQKTFVWLQEAEEKLTGVGQVGADCDSIKYQIDLIQVSNSSKSNLLSEENPCGAHRFFLLGSTCFSSCKSFPECRLSVLKCHLGNYILTHCMWTAFRISKFCNVDLI